MACPFCAYCGVGLSLESFGANFATIDHVVPRCRGGHDGAGNKTLACLGCNQRKGGRSTRAAPAFTFASLFGGTPTCGRRSQLDDLECMA